VLQGIAPRYNLTEESQGIGCVASLLMGPGELQCLLRLDIRLVQPTGEQIRLAQPDHPERMVEHEMPCHGLLNRLFQQRQGVGGPSGELIRRSQWRSDPGNREPEVRAVCQIEGPFERGNGMGEIALAQSLKARAPIRYDTAVRMISGLGDLYPFLCTSTMR
jgi:hypothetical protein